jgi:metal-sulfur cluster biosynthetic enzyme
VNEAAVRAALNAIVDPCSAVAGAPAGIVEMGLVRALAVRDGPGGASVAVCIGVTEPGCMMGASFAAAARERLEALPGVGAVDVTLDHAFDWEPADIDPAYARRLQAVREERRRAMTSMRSPKSGAHMRSAKPTPLAAATRPRDSGSL